MLFQGLGVKPGKNSHLRISYCSSTMEHVDWTVEKMGGENDREEALQLEVKLKGNS